MTAQKDFIPGSVFSNEIYTHEKQLKWSCHPAKYYKMEGWLAILRLFQSYQADERLLMKGCVQWKSVYG